MFENNFATLGRAFVLAFLMLVPCTAIGSAQELPETPAVSRVVELVECIKTKDPEARKPFLDDAFSADGDLKMSSEQRAGIVNMLHGRFAPVAVGSIVESEDHRVVADCSTSNEAMLRFEITVAAEGDHQITNVSMEVVESEEEVAVPEGMVAVVGEDGTTAEIARGVWQAKGYGYVFEITDDSLKVFNVAGEFGWQQEFDEDLFFKLVDGKENGVFTIMLLNPVGTLSGYPGCPNS